MAVKHGHGRSAGIDALVFAYDTGDTKNSYKGPPTQNYVHVNVANCSSTTGWSGTSVHTQYGLSRTLGVEKDGRTTFHVTYTPNATAGDCYHTFRLTDVNGNNVQTNGGEVFYLTFEWKSEGSQYLVEGQDKWNLSTFYGNGWKTGTHMSAQDFGSVAIGNGWYKRTVKYTAASVTGQTPLMRFSSGYKRTSGGDYNIWVANIAMTANHPPLNWLPGQSTRSATQGLLDLTGNSIVDLSNVSFDENTIKSFDGTDDALSLGTSSIFQFPHDSAWTIEFIAKANTFANTYPGFLVRGGASGDGVLVFYSAGGQTYWKHNNSQTQFHTQTIGQYNHYVITHNGSGTVTAYVDGINKGTVGNMNATNTNASLLVGRGDNYGDNTIPVFKKYSRQLTTREVKNNFNNYKSRFNL